MQSLRTRRPSESRNRLQRQPTKARLPNTSAGRRATRVDDKIKKRMSMRYADISAPTDASVPAVPTIPLGMRQGAPLSTSPEGISVEERMQASKEEQREREMRMLDKEEFDPDAYLKLKMANSTEAELRSLQSSLRGTKDEVALDLKRNVFKNYTEFMLVSKEVSTLENEMLEFKEALAEWKAMPSTLHIDDSASIAERRRNVRSSIADLRVLYANQMQNLHTQVEGSSKFVPTTPGRHIILEMDGLFALNPATYKVDHSVRFVVLDDAVLVARRRKRRNNTESDKLIAERCYALGDVAVLDTKDNASLSNVFKIKANKEVHVYRTEVAADKKHLIAQLRHLGDEIMARRRKEREGEHQRRKSLWVGGDRASQAFPSDVPPLPDFLADLASKADIGGGSEKEKTERDARWMGDFCDELTIAIALRKWDEAVTLVANGEKKLDTIPALGPKLSSLKASLTAALLQSLSMPNNRKSTIVKLVTLLIQLKAGAAARSTFLASRTDVMKKRVRMITFEGDIPMYISDLSIVVFTGIKHTADWFLASFKENEVSSCFIEWAKEQIQSYADMFRKQVYGSDIDAITVTEALKITNLQSRRLLEEYGLDFRFLFQQLLVEEPQEPIKPSAPARHQHAKKLSEQIIRTPSSTPVRSRSPATPAQPRSRSPAPPLPSLPSTTSSSPSLTQQSSSPAASPLASPAPQYAAAPRIRSPAPRVPSTASSAGRPSTPSEASVSSRIGSRAARASPAPPPRSRDRPGSAAGSRPPPVAIPRRDGMF
ncbi:hypothetical protein EIP86_009733 [Pleurotus ostreatoroseus]|nr:hypothetical protein EIP86_009733 [Pleurotus ostreatoroseus]